MQLRQYQIEDVEFLVKHKQCGIFSEMRTGKTCTAISALEQLKPKKILIVCPCSVIPSWKYEFTIWSTYTEFSIPAAIDDIVDKNFTGVVITNYEKLRGRGLNFELLQSLVQWKPDAVVIDEAHRMKDRKSQTTQALGNFKNAKIKFALTGTPCTNHPWDIWSIINWINPRQWSSYWNFLNDYFIQQPIYFGGKVAHQPIDFRPGKDKYLQAQLSQFCIQRKRADIMEWLTDITPETIPLKPSETQATIIKELETWYEYKNIICKTVLDTMIRVRQICIDPEILSIKAKSPKTEWLQQYIKDYPNENILIFSNSKKYQMKLQKKLKCNAICGDTNINDRRKYITEFQTNGGLLLCQTQACKEGITLDNADTTIFMDVMPPMADYLQAKDRMVATTPDRNKPKKLIHIVLEGTVDETCWNAVMHNIKESDLINSYSEYLTERKQDAKTT